VKSEKVVPIAYRFGGAFFCEMPFFVNRNVLVPRFDTEVLVETVILNCKPCKVLDMCTGSGCIAAVLAKHDFIVSAVDISSRALRIAKKNARLHDLDIKFIKSDLFKNLKGEKFNAIVCNPPYIKTNDIGRYDKGTLFEPRIALDGGDDGLDFYKKTISVAREYLNDNGQIFFEIDNKQEKDVEKLLQSYDFCDIKTVKDKQGLSRVIYARK
jgi:release factor glutamine methyltransferase